MPARAQRRGSRGPPCPARRMAGVRWGLHPARCHPTHRPTPARPDAPATAPAAPPPHCPAGPRSCNPERCRMCPDVAAGPAAHLLCCTQALTMWWSSELRSRSWGVVPPPGPPAGSASPGIARSFEVGTALAGPRGRGRSRRGGPAKWGGGVRVALCCVGRNTRHAGTGRCMRVVDKCVIPSIAPAARTRRPPCHLVLAGYTPAENILVEYYNPATAPLRGRTRSPAGPGPDPLVRTGLPRPAGCTPACERGYGDDHNHIGPITLACLCVGHTHTRTCALPG